MTTNNTLKSYPFPGGRPYFVTATETGIERRGTYGKTEQEALDNLALMLGLVDARVDQDGILQDEPYARPGLRATLGEIAIVALFTITTFIWSGYGN